MEDERHLGDSADALGSLSKVILTLIDKVPTDLIQRTVGPPDCKGQPRAAQGTESRKESLAHEPRWGKKGKHIRRYVDREG